MRSAVAVLALILCGAAAARAETPSVARAEILWAGLYEAQITGHMTQPGTAAGRTNELFNTRKLQATTTIDGRLGVSFGLEYALIGQPAGAEVPITIVVHLPKEGLRNPARAERMYREQWIPSPKFIGGSQHRRLHVRARVGGGAGTVELRDLVGGPETRRAILLRAGRAADGGREERAMPLRPHRLEQDRF